MEVTAGSIGFGIIVLGIIVFIAFHFHGRKKDKTFTGGGKPAGKRKQ